MIFDGGLGCLGIPLQQLSLLRRLAHGVLASKRMRRAINIAVTVVVGLVLLIPLDCFAANSQRPEAMECCLKGKCEPQAKSADCCKTGVPDRDQLGPNPTDHSTTPNVVLVIAVLPVQSNSFHLDLRESLRHPPPRLDSIPASLPLLI